MLKPLSYPDILLNLPVDGTLKLFLERERLPVSDTFVWTDDTATTEALTLAIQSCPQSDVRDAITAGLHTSAQMAGPAGMLALFQVARNDGTVFAAFILCVSDMHRAFWLFVHHPKLFEEAGDIEYADQHIPHAQQHDLGVHLPVLRTDKSRDDFAAAIKQFYQQEMDRGDVCIPRLIDRAGGTQLVCVHVKDRATSSIEFEGTELRRRVGNPIIHMALEYCETTGVVRSVIKGGAKYQHMLVDAFATHLLGVQVNPQRIKPPVLDLTALRLGFQVPQAHQDGFVNVQVKSLTMMSPDRGLKVEFTATASSEHRCVTELVADHFAADSPIAQGWEVEAARINLYYPPAPGRSRTKVIVVEVTRRGRLNLHKYDEQLRAQLEGYLITLGVLRAEQRLSPQVVASEELVEVMVFALIEI